MSEDFAEFDAPGAAKEDFGEFDEPDALPEVKEAPSPGWLPDQRVIDAAQAERSPEHKRYKELLGRWEDLKRGSKYGMDALAQGAVSGTIGKKLGVPDEFRADVDQFRAEHPYRAFATNALATAPLAMVAPNTLPAAVATGALGGALGTRSEDAAGVAKDAALGGAAGGAGWALGNYGTKALQLIAGKALEYGGKAGQLGQRAYEAMAERLGSNADDAMRASSAASSGSKLQRGLKEIIEGAELASMGAEAGSSAQAAERAIGSMKILDKPMASLSQAERAATMNAMAQGLGKRGLSVSPEAIGGTFDDMIRAAGKEPSEVSVRDAIRLVNQRDPAFAQRALVNASERWNPIRAGMDVDPREAQAVAASQGMLGDISEGLQNRFNVRGQSGGAAQLPKNTPVPLAPDEQAAAMARLKARDQAAFAARGMAQDVGELTNPGVHRGGWALNEPSDTAVLGKDAARAARQNARLNFQQSPQGQATVRDMLAEVNDQAVARGVNQAAPGGPGMSPADFARGVGLDVAPVPPEPFQPFNAQLAKSLTGTEDPSAAAIMARDRLRSINAGKARINRAGVTAAAGSVLPVVGAPSRVAAAGIGAAKAIGSDIPASIGRGAESLGKRMTTPAAMQGWFANPEVLPRLAQQPGRIGSAARYVLDGLNEGGEAGMKSRMFVLGLQPWFRELTAQQQASEE